MSWMLMVVCVAVFVGVCSGPFLLLLFLDASARRLARAKVRPQEAPAADVAPVAPAPGPRPPMAPEVTRTVPVVDLAAHRNRRRPQGAALAPEGALGRITKDASPGGEADTDGREVASRIGAAATHLTAAIDGIAAGNWPLVRADVTLAIVALVRVLGTMPTETERPQG